MHAHEIKEIEMNGKTLDKFLFVCHAHEIGELASIDWCFEMLTDNRR